MKAKKREVVWLLVFGMLLSVLCIQPAVGEEEEPEDSGNNLSLPVIWSDDVNKPLRGTLGEPSCVGDFWYVWYEVIDGNVVEMVCNPVDQADCPPAGVDAVKVYPQRDPNNDWQAESLTLIPGTDPVLKVSLIDWGDNLEAKDWTDKAIIRTETVLYQDISLAPMTGYEMIWLEGLGTDEVWGTTLATYQSDLATVYSGCARLTIQELLVYPYDVNHAPIPNEELGLVWDVNHWDGDGIGATYLNSVVWNPSEGQDYASYSSEVNVKGKVIYGYNWNTRKQADGPGHYRITFSLDDSNPEITLNTVFDPAVTQILLAEEDPNAGSENHNTTGGGEAVIDYVNNLTYIDVTLVPRRGGGGPGGGGEE